MIYLYAYDVPVNRRRTKIAKTLERFGVRLQKSVFQCDVPPELAGKIRAILLRLMDKNEDSLIIIPVCEKDLQKTERFGPEAAVCCVEGSYAVL